MDYLKNKTRIIKLLIVSVVFACSLFVFSHSASAATIYADVNTGLDMDWNDTATWVGGVVPTSTDDVIIDGSCQATTIVIGTLNYGDNADAASLNSTGYAGTITGDSTKVLNISGGAVILSNWTNSAGIVFWSGPPTLTSNAQNVGNIAITMDATLTLQDTLTCNDLNLLYGTLTTNNQTVSCSSFTSNGANSPTFNLGSSIFNVSGSWSIDDTLTINAGTSSIRFTGTNVSVNFYTQIPYEVRFNGAGSATIESSTSFTNLQRNGTALRTDTLVLNGNQEVTGILTLAGNSSINRILVQSNILGTPRTFTISGGTTVTASNVDFRDIAFSTAKNLSAISGGSGDCGGNSGITFTTAAPQTWTNASSGNWSLSTNWTSRVPLPQDDVSMAKAFGTSQTVTADMPRLGKTIDWTGATYTTNLTWALNSATAGSYTIYGGLNMTNLPTLTHTKTFYFEGRGAFNLNMNGLSFGAAVTQQMVGGTLTLTGAFNKGATGTLTFSQGTFDADTYNVTYASAMTASIPFTFYMGSGTWTLSGTGTIWSVGASTTVNAETSTILISNTSTSSKTFVGNTHTYNILNITGGGTGAVIFSGATTNTFASFWQITGGTKTIQLGNSSTQKFLAGSNFGNGANLITFNTQTAGTHAHFSKASGIVSCDYLSLKDNQGIGGAAWYAGTHSTNVSGNSGWVFTAPPPTPTSVSVSPQAVNVGSDVTFTGNWTEAESGDQDKMYICKDSACTSCNINTNPPTNCWCFSSAYQTEPDTTDTCIYTAQTADIGNRNFWLGVCDDELSCASTPLFGSSFTVGPASGGKLISVGTTTKILKMIGTTLYKLIMKSL